MDERRILLAVVLMFVFFYVYSAFFLKPAPRSKPAGAPAAQTQRAPAPPPPPSVTPGAVAAPAPRAQVAALVGERAERTITIDTQVVRAVFTNRGGELVSWRLKKYLDDRKQPLEMVATHVPGAVRPFTLRTEDADVTARLDEALYQASDAAAAIDATHRPVNLTFEFQDASGLRVRKTFAIQPDSYEIGFEATVSSGDRAFNPTMVWGPGLGDAAAAAESSRYTQKPEAIYYDQGSVRRIAVTQLTPAACTGARTDNGCAWEGNMAFAGVDDQYFISAVLPRGRARIEYEPVSVPVPDKPGQSNELVSYVAKMSRAAPGMRVFAGPKDVDALKAANPEMPLAINFGLFAMLAVPLLRTLKSINAYVGNYGWAIIILTILINAAMFPFRHKSMVSMRKLQALQPEIKAIQDRYKNLKATDPARQKMNVEMMNLYREKGVNPASGCLPMLLTMPVLFAFYAMLSQAIEVRGAPWALWIHDLSRYDPYYVLPVLMGATMVWQQRMTPSSVDPAQQKMMMFMPVMFTAFFLWAPSGLALYFLLSNLLAIGQQYVTNNMIAPAPARPARTAAAKKGK